MALSIKSIDTMKGTRDKNNHTNQQKVDHCQALVRHIPDLTHITYSGYSNNFSYQSVAYIQEWVNAIRATGKKIWWRCAFINADQDSTLEEIYEAIIEGPEAHPEWFATGDIFELQPETNPSIGVLTGDAQSITDWNTWLREKTTAAEAMFALMGYDIDCKIVSITDGYAKSGVLEAETVTHLENRVCYDLSDG
jgi:hypothetical protein